MISYQALVFSAVLVVSLCQEDLRFPPGFKFGAASAAYQVEGAWNASDKAESIWDRYVHEDPERVSDLTNGDIACDSYHLWKRDIEMAQELGLHFYRFSISWPRLLPNGFSKYISEDGKNYYNKLIDGLLEKGIEPFITLYHWDLPQNLQDLGKDKRNVHKLAFSTLSGMTTTGGWTNPLIADWFSDYSRVVFELFGDRVKWWLTINEPMMVCDVAYNTGLMAPGILSSEVGAYICNKNVLLAHAKAWRLYDTEFKPKYDGKVSLANHLIWFEPRTEANAELAELALQNSIGRYSHPIYSKEGGWPPSIQKVLERVSMSRGYSRSSLPAFTVEEIELIKGTYDFFGMNHYTSRVIRPAEKDETFQPWPMADAIDLNAITEKHPNWPSTNSTWFFVNPEGIRKLLVWLKNHYGDLEIIVTENGLSTAAGLEDDDRVQYYRDYLKQILLAIKEDGVKVTGYTAWTIMDNFEWTSGYTPRFGLYEVDFSDPMRKRTPRTSAKFYADLIKENSRSSREDL